MSVLAGGKEEVVEMIKDTLKFPVLLEPEGTLSINHETFLISESREEEGKKRKKKMKNNL